MTELLNNLPFSDRLRAAFGEPIDDFDGGALNLARLLLVFSSKMLFVSCLSDTDELEFELAVGSVSDGSAALRELSLAVVGEPLVGAWAPLNDRGYQDSLLFAFTSYRPVLGVVAEGSALKLFSCEVLSRQSVFSGRG